MTSDQVKQMLPIIIAFAERKPIQFRDLRPTARNREWTTVNPDTTEFRINEYDLNPDEWRVLPSIIGEPGGIK